MSGSIVTQQPSTSHDREKSSVEKGAAGSELIIEKYDISFDGVLS